MPPQTTANVGERPVSDRPQSIARSVNLSEAKSRLIRNQPAPPRYEPRFDRPLEKAPTGPLPTDKAPAEDLPLDELPLETSPRENLLREPVREPADPPAVNPLDEPLPAETEPLDLDPLAPSQLEEPAEAPEAQAAEELPQSEGKIFRLEPPATLVPVGADELKPGVIYLRDDPQSGRQVWSFVQANGKFWHAFGPGTTQALVHFDLRMTDEQALETLRKIDPKLAFNVTNEGTRVFLRLQADNQWKLVRTNSVPSIFDAETSLRWEMQWGRYLPVTHDRGNTWTYSDGQYWAPHWHTSMRPH